jgi:hypothetical protein
VKAYDYGDETQVRIMELPITYTIPADIDITLECVKNLREKIVAVRKEAENEVKDLEERIKQLSLIEYKGDADE